MLLGAEPTGSGQSTRHTLADLRRPALARDAGAALGEPKNLFAGAAFAHQPDHQQCLDRGRRQQRLHRALEVSHGGIPPRGATAVRRHRLPSLGADRWADPDRVETRGPAQLRRAARRHRRAVLIAVSLAPRSGERVPSRHKRVHARLRRAMAARRVRGKSGHHLQAWGNSRRDIVAPHPALAALRPPSPRFAGRGFRCTAFGARADKPARYHSGPAYAPAVAGNIDLTILSFEMSTVASMCRNIVASRKIFSTPKSSITPLPPCNSRQCCATFKISSDANNLTTLQSVSASGALSSTACAARSSSARTASIRVAMSARRSATA